MKLLRNILLILLLVVVVVIATGGFMVNRWMYGPLPQHEGELTVAGLQDTVEVLRDEWGVPHIYASNTYDLFFAQGYTQAQDRWWQMEFFRTIGRGEIQELTGRNRSALGQDTFIRKVGWRRAAENDLAAMDDDNRAQMQAFADGVNAYIMNRSPGDLAFEYNVLGIRGVNIEIEPWTPIDTLVWTKVMAWDLSGNQSTELYLSELLEALGEDKVEDYAPEWPFGEKPTIIQPQDLPPTGESFEQQVARFGAGIRGMDTKLAGSLDPEHGFVFARGADIGSNNWVVSGEKTASGSPLLADDPHLGIQMPSIWYEVGLHCQPVSDACPYNVVGLTFSPALGVVIGHNGQIAWGVTNVGWDTQDLYRIEVNPDNPLQYRWNDEWRDMVVHEEVIRFGGSDETLTIQVRETHLGPIINDNSLDDDGNLTGFNNEDPLALRWTAYETGTIVQAILDLNRAQNWEEFRQALRLWDTPSQNFVYADVEGNIGYQTPGRVPVRAPQHAGTLPVDGSTDTFEWLGYVPYEYLPSVLNPERGYIATANQALVPMTYYDSLAAALGDEFGEDANYVFGRFWAQGYRGERIVELLEATDEHTFETFQALHGDNKLIFAEEIASYLAEVDMGDDALNDARDWLIDWDYHMNIDSPQAALFAHFWVALVNAIYEDELGEVGDAGNGQMWTTTLLLAEPENTWWDDQNTEAVETRDDVLRAAFAEGHTAAIEAQGEDRSRWFWGGLHTATFISNPLGVSGIDLIEDMVNRGPVQTGGGTEIVNATGWSAGDGDFTVQAVPSMRMIIDLGDLDQSQVMHTTGQSGHPFSDQYGQMIDPWREIEYHPMLWSREQVEAAAVKRLVLQPE